VLDDNTFLTQFEKCQWPLENWHYREHIKLAYLYLCRYPMEEAMARIRDGIKAHNAAHNVPEKLTRGYHETMTRAWLQLVQLIICEYGPAENADTFCEQHPELLQTKALRLFYSHEQLMSPEAKAKFLEPDLAPLPRSRRTS
jgi:hypothetical protein